MKQYGNFVLGATTAFKTKTKQKDDDDNDTKTQ
jgi:hypothetical protein